MLRLSCLFLGLILWLETSNVWTAGNETDSHCPHTKTDTPQVYMSHSYLEVPPSSSFTLHCKICSSKNYKLKVWWEKDGERVSDLAGVGVKRKHRSVSQLSVRKVGEEHLGVYSCVVTSQWHSRAEATCHVGHVPVPPRFVSIPHQLNSTQHWLKWEVNSSSPIINYELKFRRAPYSGRGEDWVLLNVPAEAGGRGLDSGRGQERRRELRTQAYLLRGLTQGTRYEVKVRARNKFGFSESNQMMSFSTFSPVTTTLTTPTTFATSVINWRDDQQFSRKISSNELISTKRAQGLSVFSSSPGLVPLHCLWLTLTLCLGQ